MERSSSVGALVSESVSRVLGSRKLDEVGVVEACA